ncbi:ABC-2 type transport system ATP-binding protein [Sporobacter termitidis DSM 10068]|uniref:ABC-2 type transport system ATP-binding protein n=1 Tax=Sporobacter termitidis DSM 10068 TaxID=1123282 RepID=A0A1M5UGJ3_9FIRM|nr:ABC transporter ATP-binding protein [Sporobacter termitidis]SHH62165.1 ABC-2 type transport system ATP-binding protein [Sporobacter termitidis DSM 10068]
MDILSVHNLSKKYERFELKNVSFSLEHGYIMGFIGRNGAGKTTTLKSILNLVHADGGQVTILGQDFSRNELELKQKIGFMLGGTTFYPKKKLKTVADAVRRFYDEWDDALFSDYLTKFALDPDKKVEELSTGMQVKFALALALSHNAKLLILDEPTSGLDPVSRDEILELFQELIEDGKRSILFSTHITSDLEKCADYITYIKNGEIVASAEKDEFLERYKLVRGGTGALSGELRKKLIGYKENSFGFTGLIRAAELPQGQNLEVSPADIESVMIYFEKEQKQ